MLLLFTIDEDRFGLDVSRIVEIVPYISLKKLPRTPDYVVGMLNYRTNAVPVIDISKLLSGTPARRFLSTRIILIDCSPEEGSRRLIGLIAEHATETVKVDASAVVSANVGTCGNDFVDEMYMDEKGMLLRVNLEKLLSEELRGILIGTQNEPKASGEAAL